MSFFQIKELKRTDFPKTSRFFTFCKTSRQQIIIPRLFGLYQPQLDRYPWIFEIPKH